MKHVLECSHITNTIMPTTMLELASFRNPHKLAFHSLYMLLLIAQFLQNCVQEVYPLQTSKPNLSSTMSDVYLRNIAVLSAESLHVEATDLEALVDQFNPRHYYKKRCLA